MKIVHLCLSCFYIDGYRYQENELVRQHVISGHDVLVIASTETYLGNKKLGYISPGTYMGEDGAKVIRLPYGGWGPSIIKRKLRIHDGVFDLLREFAPDVIVFHGLCGWELLTVAKYRSLFPNVVLWVDSHEDKYNSANGFGAYLLHKIYYRSIIRKALKELGQILCISTETMDFCHGFYGVPRERLVFFPLGGYIAGNEEYQQLNKKFRSDLFVGENDILYVQSGKIDKKKRLSASLAAFSHVASANSRFVIVGNLEPDVKEDVEKYLSADSRIKYVGWRSADDLYGILCAADVYVQPGTQSATMQMSLCARCAVIIDEVPSHKPFLNGNGFFVKTEEDIASAMRELEREPEVLRGMSRLSYSVAKEKLDYAKMAEFLTGN